MTSSRSGLSQISDHQVRYFVHKPFCSLLGEDVWTAEDCSVCQRLHRRHADEGRDIEIGDIDLISMSVEIAPDKCINVLVDRLDILESPNTWDLFGKDAMKLGIDTVSVDLTETNSRAATSTGRAATLTRMLRINSNTSCEWRSLTAATSASLLGKYWYSEPILTPASVAIRLVLARS